MIKANHVCRKLLLELRMRKFSQIHSYSSYTLQNLSFTSIIIHAVYANM